MAEFSLASASAKQVWSTNYISDYMRQSRFAPYTGADNNFIFVSKYELQREAGKTVNIPWIGRLKANGVYDDGVLEGNEEALANANMPILLHWVRNAAIASKNETFKTDIDIVDANRSELKRWSATKMKSDIILQILGTATKADNTNVPWVNILGNGGVVIKAVASAADMNSWITTNSDRVLFGISTANNTGTFSTSAANVDSTNDKLSCAMIRQMKIMARTTEGGTTGITPYMTEDGREYFVMFAGIRAFRDLKTDSEMVAANRDARAREGDGMKNNPLFQDGDLMIDGVIVREEPYITRLLTTASTFLSAAGAASIPVEPVFLCGAAAGGIAWGQKPTPRAQKFDYDFRMGAAVEELRGLEKLNYNGLQNGMVTGFVSGVA